MFLVDLYIVEPIIDNMIVKHILNRFCDFAIDHPRAMAFICIAIFVAIVGLAGIFEGTIVPKILAFLIVSFFVIPIGFAIHSDYEELDKLKKEKEALLEKYLFDKLDEKYKNKNNSTS